MKKLLLLLPLLLALPASAQIRTKAEARNAVLQFIEAQEILDPALDAGDVPKICAALEKQLLILAYEMKQLKFYFPETNWKPMQEARMKGSRNYGCKFGDLTQRRPSTSSQLTAP